MHRRTTQGNQCETGLSPAPHIAPNARLESRGNEFFLWLSLTFLTQILTSISSPLLQVCFLLWFPAGPPACAASTLQGQQYSCNTGPFTRNETLMESSGFVLKVGGTQNSITYQIKRFQNILQIETTLPLSLSSACSSGSGGGGSGCPPPILQPSPLTMS